MAIENGGGVDPYMEYCGGFGARWSCDWVGMVNVASCSLRKKETLRLVWECVRSTCQWSDGSVALYAFLLYGSMRMDSLKLIF